MASIANLGPVNTSPPANTSGSPVCRVKESAFTVLFGFNSILLSSSNLPQSIPWPTEIRTWFAFTILVISSSNIGLNFPLSSKTERHFLNSMPITFPFSSRIRFGPQELLTSILSDNASSISSSRAGISSRLSRQNMLTFEAPTLVAVLATSIATLPPPITTTSPSRFTSLPKFTLRKKSTPVITPSESSPWIPRFLPNWAPIAI